MTREEIELVRNHISNIPALGGIYGPVLLEWLEVIMKERDELLAKVQEFEEKLQKLQKPGDYKSKLADMMKRDAEKEIYGKAWEEAILAGKSRDEAHEAGKEAVETWRKT